MNENAASMKGVTLLSFSFIFVLFSANLMGFCDRLLLAHFSIEGLESGMTALWLSQLFQIPIIRATAMTQVFVARHKGAEEPHLIGPCVWQMVWLSFATMVIILPLARPVGTFFFANTLLIEGKTCFYYFMSFSFLFPLGAVLAAFYLGRGEGKKVIKMSVMSHGLHLLLDFPLIFGVAGVIPPMGPLGSVIAAITSQLFFCFFLFLDFIHSKHEAYRTREYFFKLSLFWSYTRIGVPRGIARFVQLAAWVGTTRLMVLKGSDYSAVLAFGGSLQLFLNCLNEGLSQALATIGSYFIGVQKTFIRKLIQSASFFLSVELALLAIPLLLFPEVVISLFFKEETTGALQAILIASCGLIWLLFLAEGLNMIGFGLVSAYGDTLFQMGLSPSNWILSFLPTYLFVYRGGSPPEQFWLIMLLGCFFNAAAYFVRLRYKKQGRLLEKLLH